MSFEAESTIVTCLESFEEGRGDAGLVSASAIKSSCRYEALEKSF